jgi:hypothetical protein
MKVAVSPSATKFVLVHGGRLWVWAGTAWLPDEIYVDLGGIRRRRVRACWNGCAYLV